MNRIKNQFDTCSKTGRRALVVYLTAGDPDLATTVAAAKAAIEAGADLLEIGVPFSDPVADGPVIQRAMLRSLAGGGGFLQALEVVKQIRAYSQVPVVLFGYANPLFYLGMQKAYAMMREAGVDGVLVVDIPFEESAVMRAAARAASLDWVALVAPTTGKERTQALVREASGFIYMISMTGVTGGALNSLDRVTPLIDAIREVSDIPVCVGFGVRDRASAALVARVADGVVVGSAIVAALEKGAESGKAILAVSECVKELRLGVDAPR